MKLMRIVHDILFENTSTKVVQLSLTQTVKGKNPTYIIHTSEGKKICEYSPNHRIGASGKMNGRKSFNNHSYICQIIWDSANINRIAGVDVVSHMNSIDTRMGRFEGSSKTPDAVPYKKLDWFVEKLNNLMVKHHINIQFSK